MPSPTRRLAAGLAVLAPFAALRAARAQGVAPAGRPATGLSIDSLATMLTGMGYEPTVADTRKYLTIKSEDYTVQFTFASGSGDLIVFVYLQKLTSDQVDKLNMKQLLLINDNGPGWFSLEKDGDDFRVYVQRMMPPAAANPVTLRASIENVVKLTSANEDLWNPSRWKPS